MASRHSLLIVDYVVFGATIFISLGIGLYFAMSGGLQRTTSEFLVGGRAMKFLPVAVSLMVSFESSIMMLGYLAEVYVYGAQLFIALFGFMAAFLICRVLMIPLIHPLKLTSAYEGTIDAGGIKAVGTTAAQGGRLNFFNFDMDPTVRHTFWGLFLGTFARPSGLIFNQSTIQRVCSTPTLAAAKK
ncbi:sodium-coupled monocarboxylate transporter 1-like [Haliotis cracherodii]|uniref:sodium-coupled monocarboxylate transporter 1-like n=1 Tax=Haliotis cracherodii TaxID=6455 RepID=UPI0039E7CAFD